MKYTDACHLLGLNATAEFDDAQLKKAFKKAALVHHPDKNLNRQDAAKERFQDVTKAYQFLSSCVAKGQTGPHQPRFATADNYDNDDNDDDNEGGYYYYNDDDDDDDNNNNGQQDDYQDFMFRMFFQKMQHARHHAQQRQQQQRQQQGHYHATTRMGMGMHPDGTPFIFVSGFGGFTNAEEEDDDDDDEYHEDYYQDDGEHYHDYYEDDYDDQDDNDDDDDQEAWAELLERLAEAKRRQDDARAKARQKRDAHAQYMAERARQAELEGRDFFEAWNVKQLKGECQRRGLSIKNLQQAEIVSRLIQDEAKKRLRQQRKQEAPLLDEWAEVIHMKQHRADMEGLKVRVIDFYDERYTVEWDTNAGKKKKKGQTHLRESKKARVKPENLRLWGTGEPILTQDNAANSSSSTSDKENKDKQQQTKSGSNSNTSGGGKKKKSKAQTKTSADDNKETAMASDETKAEAKPKPNKEKEQEVPTTKCCAICHKEHKFEASKTVKTDENNQDGSENNNDNDNDIDQKADNKSENIGKVVILPCGHIFCQDCCDGRFLPDPTSTVSIRSCRVCHTRDPGVDSLMTLPYIVALRDPPQSLLDTMFKEYSLIVSCASVEALEQRLKGELDSLKAQKSRAIKAKKDEIYSNAINKQSGKDAGKDKKGKQIKQMLASIEAEFEPQRKELLRAHATLWRSVAKTGTVKELQEQRDAAIDETTKAINKHYRKASRDCHPDRHGSDHQKEFDDLTKARDTLSDVGLRHTYMEQMLQIVCKVGTHWIQASHESWVLKHQPDLAAQNSTKRPSEAGTKQRPLQIEGGMMQTTPRKPGIAILNVNERRIRVTLAIPMRSWYEFMTYCKEVHIAGENGGEVEFVKTIPKNDFQSKLDGEIEAELTLTDFGNWQIRWWFTAERDGTAQESVRSCDAAVLLTSPKYQAKVQLMKAFEKVALKRANEINSAIRKLSTSTKNDSGEIEQAYHSLQGSILRAMQCEYHLTKAMKEVGSHALASGTTPLESLRSALAATRPFKESLDQALVAKEKRNAKKNFTNSVVDILSTGDGSAWVATVTKEQLAEMKGDANRLYQLLREGKIAFNLDVVDAATLFAAADRKDLFSKKQLQVLIERSEEVEIRAAEEARRWAIENEKRESAEKMRLEMEKRAAFMERGLTVQIQGLKSEPSLNGSLATYMGLGQAERYILRLYEGREIAVKKQNFCKYDGSVEAKFHGKKVEWSCKRCTFLHQGPNAAAVKFCSMCGLSREATIESDSAAEGKGTTADKVADEIDVDPPPKNQKVVARVAETKPAVANDESVADETTMTPKKSPRKTRQQVTPIPSFDQLHDTPPLTLNNAKSPAETEDHAPSAKVPPESADKKSTEMPRCRYQFRCRRVINGTCKFRHSAEEIAFIIGKIPVVNTAPPEETGESHASVVSDPSFVDEKIMAKTNFESSVKVASEAVGFIVGTKRSNLKALQRRTGTKIVLKDKTKADGGPKTFQVRGPTQEAVEDALSMIEKRAHKFDISLRQQSRDVTSTEGSSMSTVPSVIHGPDDEKHYQSMVTQPETTPTLSGGTDLKNFILTHERSLKCSTTEFVAWLNSEDIATVTDLADACEDEEFISELVAHGLKRFKLASFSKSAAVFGSSRAVAN